MDIIHQTQYAKEHWWNELITLLLSMSNIEPQAKLVD